MPQTDGNVANTPDQKARFLYERALTHHRANRLDAAIENYTQAIELSPLSADIYNNLGVALRANKRVKAAIACYRRSLSIKPNSASVYTNLGNALQDCGEFSHAAEAHRRAVKCAPQSAKAVFNAGRALNDAGESKTALAHFARAVKIEPNFTLAKLEYAKTLLRLGDWGRGFKGLNIRFNIPNLDPRRPNIPMWDGSSLQGKSVFINFEDSEGRLIQFLRFLPQLKRRGATIFVECPPHLNQLVEASPYVDGTPNPGTPVTGIDFQIPLLSLPLHLNTQVKNLGGTAGYLPMPKYGGHVLDVYPQTRLAVGLAWSGEWGGRSETIRDGVNKVQLDDFSALFGLPDLQLFSLELGHGARDIVRLGLQPIIEQTSSTIMDVADMAGIIHQLDLVICVDGVAAHVAGAMGKPVWMLTPSNSDWSWLLEQNNSPWYASMHLFRKGPNQPWIDAVNAIRHGLIDVLKGNA